MDLPTPHTPPSSLLQPYSYIEQIPGKGVRNALIDAFNLWLNAPSSKLALIKTLVTMLHNASLMIDDIEDNSKLRRGVPVAHHIYGSPLTINAGNYAYFLALEKCIELDSPAAVKVFTEEMLNLHRGQGHDIFWRDSAICPTEEQYKDMVLDKTGGLFRLGVRILHCFSSNSEDMTSLVNMLALYFQIRDDYMNLASADYHKNKSFCEDLTEGKFSFPIIHAIRSDLEDTRLLHILKRRVEDENVKKYAVQYMELQGSFEYCRKVLQKLKSDIEAEIKRLGGNPILEELVTKLIATCIQP